MNQKDYVAIAEILHGYTGYFQEDRPRLAKMMCSELADYFEKEEAIVFDETGIITGFNRSVFLKGCGVE